MDRVRGHETHISHEYVQGWCPQEFHKTPVAIFLIAKAAVCIWTTKLTKLSGF